MSSEAEMTFSESLLLKTEAIISEIRFIFILHGIVLALVIAAGLICNLLVLRMLCRRDLTSPPYYILRSMIMCDILILLYSIYSDVHPAISSFIQMKGFPSLNFDRKWNGSENATAANGDEKIMLLLTSLAELDDLYLKDNKSIELRNITRNSVQEEIDVLFSNGSVAYNSREDGIIINSRPIAQAVERFIGYFLMNTGLLLMLVLAIERCVAVVRPLKVLSIVTIGRSRIAIGVILFFCLIFHLPQLCLEIARANNQPISDDFEGTVLQSFRRVYERVFVTISLILTSIILGLNIFLLMKMYFVKRDNAFLHPHQRRKRHSELSITVLVIAIIFIQVPVYVFMNVFSLLTMEEFLTHFETVTKTAVILRFAYVTNSALNFLLYCVFGKQFRRSFVKLYCTSCTSRSPVPGSKSKSTTSGTGTPKLIRMTFDPLVKDNSNRL